MKTKILLLSLVFACFGSGCAVYQTQDRDASSYVAIGHKPFKIVKTNITASAKNKRFSCAMIGEAEIMRRAHAALHEAGNLADNQAFVNFRFDSVFTNSLFSCTNELFISADVVEFM